MCFEHAYVGRVAVCDTPIIDGVDYGCLIVCTCKVDCCMVSWQEN